jgi:aspartate kinase
MGVRVLKYGGTSVETPELILAVARRILAGRASGDPIVVVVSAMGQTTDELIRLAHRVSRTPSHRELDMLLTTGERVSMALLSMALQSLGCPAISFTGSQSGIVTDSRQGDARIQRVQAFRIREELERERVVIVAGFQGVSPRKEITTLGRGGSDTTAVALAIHLGAQCCEIHTDVPGVLSADPRIVPGARFLPEIDYEPMITWSHLGGRVLFRRAVILARKYAMPVEVLSSRDAQPGTRIPRRTGPDGESVVRPAGSPPEPSALSAPSAKSAVNHHGELLAEEDSMESDRVLGVALGSPVRWVRVTIPPQAPAAPSVESSPAPVSDTRSLSPTAAPPADGSPLFLFFSRTRLPDGSALVQFAAAEDEDVQAWLDPARWGAGAVVVVEAQAALVSLVGEGVLASGDVLRRAESTLSMAGVAVWGLQTGTLSVSMLVPSDQGETATRLLHREMVERL